MSKHCLTKMAYESDDDEHWFCDRCGHQFEIGLDYSIASGMGEVCVICDDHIIMGKCTYVPCGCKTCPSEGMVKVIDEEFCFECAPEVQSNVFKHVYNDVIDEIRREFVQPRLRRNSERARLLITLDETMTQNGGLFRFIYEYI